MSSCTQTKARTRNWLVCPTSSPQFPKLHINVFDDLNYRRSTRSLGTNASENENQHAGFCYLALGMKMDRIFLRHRLGDKAVVARLA